MKDKPVIAIDGPAGAGKSTVAKGVASKLGFRYIDTGALYRTVALVASQAKLNLKDEKSIAAEIRRHKLEFNSEGELLLDGAEVGDSIRTNEAAEGASAVSSLPEVRAALLEIQREMGRNGSAVLEGRDIGTVVFPDAEFKFFLKASSTERARRRYLQLKEKGMDVSFDEIRKSQVDRDRQDSERNISPLEKADDAVEIDCERISAEDVTETICKAVGNPP